MALPQHGARLGGEVHERAEEGPEADPAAAQPGHLGDLLLGQREARENRVGVIGEQLSGLRGMHALAGAPHQLGTDLALEQGDLPRDGRLGERELPAGRGEGAQCHHGPQGRELGQVIDAAMR